MIDRSSDRVVPETLRVVVVHWNQPERCIQTVRRLVGDRVPVAVTVVDNDSGDVAVDQLEVELGDLIEAGTVEVVRTGRNAGFGPGANVGLRRFLSRASDGEWVGLCPHDVGFADDCLERLLGAVDAVPAAGLACADVGDGMVPVIDPYFGGLTVPARRWRPGGGAPTGEEGWEDVAFPHGTFMLLRRGCIAEVGVFDERYFSYCEEADLAVRACRAGWQVGLVRGARVTNLHLGSSVPLVDYLQTRNTILLVRTTSGRYHAAVRTVISVVQMVLGVIWPARRPLVFDAVARRRGVVDALRGRWGPPPSDLGRPQAVATSS